VAAHSLLDKAGLRLLLFLTCTQNCNDSDKNYFQFGLDMITAIDFSIYPQVINLLRMYLYCIDKAERKTNGKQDRHAREQHISEKRISYPIRHET